MVVRGAGRIDVENRRIGGRERVEMAQRVSAVTRGLP